MALSNTLHLPTFCSVRGPTLPLQCKTRIAASGLGKASLLRARALHTDREQDPAQVPDTKLVVQDGFKLQSTAMPIAALAAGRHSVPG